MDFEWDEAKSQKNRRERGFDFDFATRIFAGLIVEDMDDRFNYGEARTKAIGMAGGIVLVVIYTDRGDVRRIISARKAEKKERALWHAST